MGGVYHRINKPSTIKQCVIRALSRGASSDSFPFPLASLSPPGSHTGLGRAGLGCTPTNPGILIPLGLSLTLDVLFDQNCFQHTNSVTRELEVPKHFLFLSPRLLCISALSFQVEVGRLYSSLLDKTPRTRILYVHV